MTTIETLAVVFAVYGVVFLAHRATQVLDSIEVRWPDKPGTVQRFPGVIANHVVDLSEGDEKPKYGK